MRGWLEVHIFCGIVGPVLVTFHTSFKFNGIISVAYWSMVAVVAVGLRRPLPVRAHPEDHPRRRADARRDPRRGPTAQRAARGRVAAAGRRSSGCTSASGTRAGGRRLGRSGRLRSGSVCDALRAGLRRGGRGRRLAAASPARRRARAAPPAGWRTCRGRSRLFAMWHVFHLPLVYVMFAIAALHVGLAVYLGLRVGRADAEATMGLGLLDDGRRSLTLAALLAAAACAGGDGLRRAQLGHARCRRARSRRRTRRSRARTTARSATSRAEGDAPTLPVLPQADRRADRGEEGRAPRRHGRLRGLPRRARGRRRRAAAVRSEDVRPRGRDRASRSTAGTRRWRATARGATRRGRSSTLAPACGSCHADIAQGSARRRLPRPATRRPSPFKDARTRFDHAKAAFPLTGAHRTVDVREVPRQPGRSRA